MFLSSTHLSLRGMQGLDRLGYEVQSLGLLTGPGFRIRAKGVAPRAIHEAGNSQKHHPLFRYFLRAFDKAGIPVRTASGRMPSQSLVRLSTESHIDQLHILWDKLAPKLARGKGASDRIAELIRTPGSPFTPTNILDSLQTFYPVALRDYPEQLSQVMASLAKMRSKLGI